MVAKKGLGRGLDSIIPKPEKLPADTGKRKKETETATAEIMVSINEIEPNKDQPRKNFDEDTLAELAESIRQFGVIQPLLLKKRENYYEIVAGERRWRASVMAGLKEVPAIIREYSEQEVMEISLIENLQREDLNPIEEAQAFQRLITEFHLKQDEVAERVSKSRTAIANSMRLLKLDERVQKMVIDDMISSGHARALLSLEEKELQYNTAMRIFDEKLSVRETERLVKKLLSEREQQKLSEEAAATSPVIYRSLEEQMKTIIGSKVSIHNRSNGKGKIEIEYYSGDDLERIMELFQQIQK
ncbi:MAG: ParB/RepB/Spo0J family partition protein [Lachnospiraceae bacterium]|jgi:ParB family chromosome partitioning protein|nr:ParB/RepB/Spo0J family partition protein [Lachnospiraceae bacterium]